VTDTSEIKTRPPDTNLGHGGAGRPGDQTPLGDLSAVLAHELRNPLSSIKGAAQILMQEWGHQKPQNEFLAIILDEVDTLTALTTEFLDYARPLYPELTWGSWNDLIGRAIASVQSVADVADITIAFEFEEDLPPVLLDAYQMERAVRNVLLNAVEASHRGGCVTVRTFRAHDEVVVSVTDQGIGVPIEYMPRLFVPFFTTKLTGTGLGLPVARKIVCEHGGEVTATQNDGPGITVFIHLPASGEG